MDPRFQRTHGVLDLDTIEKLRSTHIVIAGVGGAGGQVAVDATRMGIGYLTLADFDVYERHNSNRQIGCFESTVGQRKIDVVSKLCRDINPELIIREVPEGVTPTNVQSLVQGQPGVPAPSYVIEVIDIAGVEAKVLLHRACRKLGVVAMTGIMVGLGAALIVYLPDAPGYDALYVTREGKLDLQRAVPRLGSYMLEDVLQRCFRGEGHAPTCVVGAVTASALMISEIVRGVMKGAKSMTAWPKTVYVDFFDRAFQIIEA